eukprot:3025364-Pyramimonas_sp.AAC.1
MRARSRLRTGVAMFPAAVQARVLHAHSMAPHLHKLMPKSVQTCDLNDTSFTIILLVLTVHVMSHLVVRGPSQTESCLR